MHVVGWQLPKRSHRGGYCRALVEGWRIAKRSTQWYWFRASGSHGPSKNHAWVPGRRASVKWQCWGLPWRSMFPAKKLRLRRLLAWAAGLSFCTVLLIGFREQQQAPALPDVAPRDVNAIGGQRAADPQPLPGQAPAPGAQLAARINAARGKAASQGQAGGSDRPWYMRGGRRRPLPGDTGSLWPHEDSGDRIEQQLMFVPEDYKRNSTRIKKILLMRGLGGWGDLPRGRAVFLRDKCPVDTCEIVTSQEEAPDADAVLFKDRFVAPKYRRPWHQVWILYLLECPYHTQSFANFRNIFNWTATYRHDSDIVAPYEKFVRYDDGGVTTARPPASAARNKTKKVAWFVSNCAARNQRLQFARKLAAYIDVDIYGTCGSLKCPRAQAGHCFELLDRDYKFYLAFENSNCKDYITEKFFVNGLGRDVVPIVMGGRPLDYLRASPDHSFIHVEDFPSAKALAEYLHLLDRNETLYNEYLRWKGSGEFINTYFWCRLCAMLHAPPLPKVYPDIGAWWAGPGTCRSDRWRDFKPKPDPVAYVLT
ncbi:glycoprotein 3-alpha-L-fucosyltransferase A-like isoform X3 [Dermacentor albipictus]|uniref:glycoprotein 3-alpha-L-fucosyltransferase A-like isoform X3 n=1 Tax=Dermacentor albipictus TaxID=60249 RepID=UPI0038FD21CD